MNKIQDFIRWYNNEFKQTELFLPLTETVENSPWHREKNVGIHTDMVLFQYLTTINPYETSQEELCGAFACAFHDVGKPAARVEKFKPERGNYVAFPGHEQVSAREWENFAVANWAELNTINNDVYNIYRVGWLVENHLPWDIKNPEKRRALAETVLRLGMQEAFTNVLVADNLGRISDDAEARIEKVWKWIAEFREFSNSVFNSIFNDERPNSNHVLYLPVAPSGAGKSTYRRKLIESDPDLAAFSLDDLRHEFYGEDYSVAYKMSAADNQFSSKANARFVQMVKAGGNLYVDNTNLSRKRRRFYITEARRHGYTVQAVLFPNTLQTLLDRQNLRSDKSVPEVAVRQHYSSLQLPSFGEVDHIEIVMPN